MNIRRNWLGSEITVNRKRLIDCISPEASLWEGIVVLLVAAAAGATTGAVFTLLVLRLWW